MVRLPPEARYLSLLRNVQTGSGVRAASYTVGTTDSFPTYTHTHTRTHTIHSFIHSYWSQNRKGRNYMEDLRADGDGDT